MWLTLTWDVFKLLLPIYDINKLLRLTLTWDVFKYISKFWTIIPKWD